MSDGAYQTRLLRAYEARAAYPLISLEHSEITVDLWLAFVRRANRGTRQQRGLVAITDRRGTIHTVFAYQVEASLSAAAALRVTDIIMGRLPGNTLQRAALACIDRLAAELGSDNVKIEFLEALATEDRGTLSEAGFFISGVNFQRTTIEPDRRCGRRIQEALSLRFATRGDPRLRSDVGRSALDPRGDVVDEIAKLTRPAESF